MRNDVITVLKGSHEAAIIEAELLRQMILDNSTDDGLCAALVAIRRKQQALSDELDTQIKMLRAQRL